MLMFKLLKRWLLPWLWRDDHELHEGCAQCFIEKYAVSGFDGVACHTCLSGLSRKAAIVESGLQ